MEQASNGGDILVANHRDLARLVGAVKSNGILNTLIWSEFMSCGRSFSAKSSMSMRQEFTVRYVEGPGIRIRPGRHDGSSR